MKIVLICEVFKPPFNEGIRKFALELSKSLASLGHQIMVITKLGKSSRMEGLEVRKIIKNRLFLSFSLFKVLSTQDFDRCIYIPSSSGTFWSYVRNKMLEFYLRKPVILVLLQTNPYPFWKKWIIKFFFKPQKVFTQDLLTYKLFKNELNISLIPGGVDLNRFRPIQKHEKNALRCKYSIPIEKKVVLHVGHLNDKRGLNDLCKLKESDREILFVVSSAFTTDISLKYKLQKQGIIVWDEFFNSIEELYQLSDCYLFPAQQNNASISCPLSILEAMACNLPVVIRNIGGFSMVFPEDKDGIFYFSNVIELVKKTKLALSLSNVKTRILAESYSWLNIAKKLLVNYH